jgi:hypothetical protein
MIHLLTYPGSLGGLVQAVRSDLRRKVPLEKSIGAVTRDPLPLNKAGLEKVIR